MSSELSALVASHTPYLHPFAISLTRDRDSALDLCQETMYRALVNIDKYNTGTNLRSWLYTIMRNIFINDYRKRKKHPVIAADETWFANKADRPVANTAIDLLAQKELEQVVRMLPAIFRTSFLLYVEGYKYNEIAGMLNEPLGTIKSRIHFARKFLQKRVRNN